MAKDNFIRSHVYIANLWRIYPSAAGSQNIPGLLWREIFCYCACSSLSWVTKSQPTFTYPMCFRSTLILSYHSHLDLHSSVFPSGLPTNNSYFLGPSCMPQCPNTNHFFNLTVLARSTTQEHVPFYAVFFLSLSIFYIVKVIYVSRDSALGTVTRLWTGYPRNLFLMGQGTYSFQMDPEAPLASYSFGTGDSFQVGKAAGAWSRPPTYF
jgi:hypothetical protein